MNATHIFFHWPDGGIWSNLLASIIVGVIAWFWKIKPHFQKIHTHQEKILKEVRNGKKRDK